MKLVCEKCASDCLEEYGSKSILDGKTGYRCKTCENIMGPARSRVLIVFLMTLSVAVTLAGILFVIGYFTNWMNMRASSTAMGKGYFVIAGGVVGPITFWALLQALKEKMPRRVQ